MESSRNIAENTTSFLYKSITRYDLALSLGVSTSYFAVSGKAALSAAIGAAILVLQELTKPLSFSWNHLRKSLGFEKEPLSPSLFLRAIVATGIAAYSQKELLLDINPPINTHNEVLGFMNTTTLAYMIYRTSAFLPLLVEKEIKNTFVDLSKNSFSLEKTLKNHPHQIHNVSLLLPTKKRLAYQLKHYLEPQAPFEKISKSFQRYQIYASSVSHTYHPLEAFSDDYKNIYLEVLKKMFPETFEQLTVQLLYAHRYGLTNEQTLWKQFFSHTTKENVQVLQPGVTKETFSYDSLDMRISRVLKTNLSLQEISLERHIEQELKHNRKFFSPVTIPFDTALMQIYYDHPVLYDVLCTSTPDQQKNLLKLHLANAPLLDSVYDSFDTQKKQDLEKKHLEHPLVSHELYMRPLANSAKQLMLLPDTYYVHYLDFHANNTLYDKQNGAFVTLDHPFKGKVPAVFTLVDALDHRLGLFDNFEERIAVAKDYLASQGPPLEEVPAQYLHALFLRLDARIRRWSTPQHPYQDERVTELERGIATFEQLAIYDSSLAPLAKERIAASEILIRSI